MTFDELNARMRVAAKNEILFQRGINFDELPAWQKRGVGAWWGIAIKYAVNPKTGEEVTVERRELRTETELPLGEEYGRFVQERLAESERAR